MQFRRGRLIPGLILILFGITFWLGQYFEFGPGLVLIFIGLVFLLSYLFVRWYGILIPGMITLGLGIGLALQRYAQPSVTVPLGLGLGFIAIFVVDFIVNRTTRWWPLIPGLVLALVGMTSVFPETRVWLERGWPAILVAAGLLILAGEFLRGRSKTSTS